MNQKTMITTIDNPFDPYTQFSDWLAEDIRLGHYTCSKLGRFAVQLGYVEDVDDEERNEELIDYMIKYDLEGIYKKVVVDENDSFDSKCLRF